MIKLKRAYDPPASSDGSRFLVERLWPRGIKKTALKMDAWLKDVAPSTELRKWFGHDPEKWSEFRKRYFVQLRRSGAAVEVLLEAAWKGTVTLLYSSHETEHNNAVALKEFLDTRLKRAA